MNVQDTIDKRDYLQHEIAQLHNKAIGEIWEDNDKRDMLQNMGRIRTVFKLSKESVRITDDNLQYRMKLTYLLQESAVQKSLMLNIKMYKKTGQFERLLNIKYFHDSIIGSLIYYIKCVENGHCVY